MNKYEKYTKYGFEITDKVFIKNQIHIIAYRHISKDYVIGLDYNIETGEWQHGHYNYQTREEANFALIDYLYNYCK